MRKVRQEKGQINRLGITIEADGINFAIAAKGAKKIALLLYKKGLQEIEAEITFDEARRMGDVQAVFVPGLAPGEYEYNYRIDGKLIQDPYAQVILGREKFGGEHNQETMVRCGFDLDEYDWKDDMQPCIPYHEAVMYSLHVRGFTKQLGAKVRHRGTFKGILEKAAYLKELGVNQVKLMPAYEFDEVIETPKKADTRFTDLTAEPVGSRVNFWGYGSGYYFTPKRSFASGTDPQREFRDMVRSLHALGIEVWLEFFFTADVDYRMAADCLYHWREKYHIDGFQLVGNQYLAVILARDPLFTDVGILSDYFKQDEVYHDGHLPIRRNLGEYNDGFKNDVRRFLKGDDNQLNAFAFRSRRNPGYCGIVNYIADHNGFTLMDLVSYNEKHNEANGEQNQDGPVKNESWNCGTEGPTRKKKIQLLRYRQIKNALTMLFLSAGTPMLQAGDELGNLQGGNNNPYCQDNEITWIDWKSSRKNAEITRFVQDIISFRKRHKILHMEKELRVMDSLSCGYPDLSYHGERAWYGEFENGNRQLGVLYCGKYAGEDCFIYAVYNLHWTTHEFALPHLPEEMKWYQAVDTGFGVYPEGEEQLLEEKRMFEVPGRTVIVLVGRK